jgi:hypothetical protein
VQPGQPGGGEYRENINLTSFRVLAGQTVVLLRGGDDKGSQGAYRLT